MSILLPKHTIPMLGGRGPDGAFWMTEASGAISEADLLQCRHCQMTWRYVLGSGRKRGWCRHCNGPLCGKPSCMAACLPFMDRIVAGERAAERAARG